MWERTMIKRILNPDQSEPSSRFKLKPLGKIYWTRFLSAIFAAIICSVSGQTDFIGVTIGISCYIISFAIIRFVLHISPEELGDKKTIYIKGIGTYFFTWVTVWTILYTLIHV